MKSLAHTSTSFIILILPFITQAKEYALTIALSNDLSNYDNMAIACPAETTAENNFIQQNSLGKNALLVKKTYSKKKSPSEEIEICKNVYKISLVYRPRYSSFYFGYEIYYNSKDSLRFENFANLYPLKDFASVEEAIESSKSKISRGIYQVKRCFRFIAQTVSNAIGLGNKQLLLNGDRMEFMWMYTFTLKFNLTKKILEHTSHEILPQSEWNVWEKCRDFSLGSEVFEGTDVDVLYNNQAKIFENFKFPSNLCRSSEQCLMKWSLIPLDLYDHTSSEPRYCSNMSTVPIWKEKVGKILKKLDKYIYTLYQVLIELKITYESVYVQSGITGEHQFAPKESSSSSRKATLYLDPTDQKIPVPKIISKKVRYRLKDCNINDSSCWYAVIIVIHNDPFYSPKDKVCFNEDVTNEWGWREIAMGSEGYQYDVIYACPNVETVQKKLGLNIEKNENRNLNLEKFVYSKKGDETNIKKHLDEKFKKFTQEKEF